MTTGSFDAGAYVYSGTYLPDDGTHDTEFRKTFWTPTAFAYALLDPGWIVTDPDPTLTPGAAGDDTLIGTVINPGTTGDGYFFKWVLSNPTGSTLAYYAAIYPSPTDTGDTPDIWVRLGRHGIWIDVAPFGTMWDIDETTFLAAIEPPGPAPVYMSIRIPGPEGTWSPINQPLAPLPVYVRVVIPGPLTARPPDPTPAPGVLVPRFTRVLFNEAELDAYWDVNCQAELSGPGTGSVTVPRTLVGALGLGDVMAFEFGHRRVQTCVVESVSDHVLAPGEEKDENVTFTGRGLVAEWDRALVYPDLGAEHPERISQPVQTERHMNWTASSGTFNWVTNWNLAVETHAYYGAAADSLIPPRFIRPEGWPTRYSSWIWDRNSSGPVPTGDIYFRATTDIPPVTAANRWQIWTACDDEYEFWFDGVKVTERTGYYTGQAEHVELQLGQHFHYIAARCTNRVGRAGLQCAILPVASSGVLGTPWVTSGAEWHVLGYPATPPGMTPGQIIRVLLAECQFRGALPGWTCHFTDITDSSGIHWETLPDITIKVGMTMLEMLDQLAETYLEYKFNTNRELYCWRKGWPGATETGFTDTVDYTVVTEG